MKSSFDINYEKNDQLTTSMFNPVLRNYSAGKNLKADIQAT